MKKLLSIAFTTLMAICFAVAANAAVGTVVYGYKTGTEPNLDMIDETWGEPAIYVTKDSPNAELHKYWTEEIDTSYYAHAGTGPNGRQSIQPEDSDFWLYILYDDKNLYVALKSPDTLISGSPEFHRGDGVHFWCQPLDTMNDPYSDYGVGHELTEYDKAYQDLESYYHFYWNLAQDNVGVNRLFASLNADVANLHFYDGYMHAIISIPLINFGIQKNFDLHGFEFGTSIMRCSSKSGYDEGYAGWLSWGATLRDYTPTLKCVNTIILIDPAREAETTETEAIETEAVETETIVTEAVATEAVVTEAVVTEAVVTEAVVTEAVVTEAVVTEAVATEAVVTEAVETEAVETETVVTEAVVTEAVATETVVTEAVVTDAVVTEAVVTEAVVTDIVITDPVSIEPIVTEPIMIDPNSTEPITNNKNNTRTGLNVGIIVVVIVVGVVVVTTAKKKK